MHFALTETQTELKAAARRYLSDRYPADRIARLAAAGAGGAHHTAHDTEGWAELERQGWLDEDLGMVELALLAEEGGRALHPAPWWPTAGLAVPVYQAARSERPGPATLADGTSTCRAEPVARGARRGAGDCAGGWLLDGMVGCVVDPQVAAEILVAARTAGGVALFGVPPYGHGVALTGRAGIDPLRALAGVELTKAPARLLVGAAEAGRLLAAIADRSTVLLACEAVGVADRALEMAVDHAKTREQFGRPIGSYQAVAHLLAESYAELELARSLTYRAACLLDDVRHGRVDGAGSALACAVHAGRRAAVQVCEAAIQVCAGIGVTWEFPLHRWYRRALWIDAYAAGRPDPLTTIAEAVLG
ncbi:MAG TPA: acyl-CoA dehydrogenase family protein [Pseudonocardiaceae bacterium]|jgi:alkylation response protein AidB-like acyl-CoA dehydrogenase